MEAQRRRRDELSKSSGPQSDGVRSCHRLCPCRRSECHSVEQRVHVPCRAMLFLDYISQEHQQTLGLPVVVCRACRAPTFSDTVYLARHVTHTIDAARIGPFGAIEIVSQDDVQLSGFI